jgi:Asp-tRNA(Asn)/Glu-tRNA(Gln) amidotransferase A subunit family amidase
MLPTIHAAAEDIRNGRLSPVDLVKSCLERIHRCEDRVRAWVLIDGEGALARAEECEREIERGGWRGPLHGIPLAIKDIFDVFDWPTAAGSRLWKNSIARQDAVVVRRLRQAGAVFLGKTVTTQYASFDPPPTRNPWNTERTPGGSSSGSAAALACGMCIGALGSQTGGSITRPASFCAVAGCKPTFGHVSVDGVVPLAPSMDHVGPMARCVRDLEILLQAIAGEWWGATSRPRAGREDAPPPAPIRSGSPRLGRLRGLFDHRADSEVAGMMRQVCARLEKKGATIVDVPEPAAFAEVLPRHRTVMAVEAAAFHQERLRRHPEDYDPWIRNLLEDGIKCPAPEYARCKDHQRLLRSDMRSCFVSVDALLTPATTSPAPDAGSTGDPAFNSPWSYTGFPTISFPVGLSTDGLPLAIQLVGRPWSERDLFGVAIWCEEMLGVTLGEPPVCHSTSQTTME